MNLETSNPRIHIFKYGTVVIELACHVEAGMLESQESQELAAGLADATSEAKSVHGSSQKSRYFN